jgi:ribosomal silencing factor RsfS
MGSRNYFNYYSSPPPFQKEGKKKKEIRGKEKKNWVLVNITNLML